MSRRLEPRSPFWQLSAHRRTIILLVLTAFALYILLPLVSGRRKGGLSELAVADWRWLIAAFFASFATYACAALIYLLLAKHPLRYNRTVLAQLAATFVNRIIPAGIGTVSVSYDYLRKQDHTRLEAGVVVGANAVTGLTGHILILLATVLLSRRAVSGLAFPDWHLSAWLWLLPVALIGAAAGVMQTRQLRSKVTKGIRSVVQNVKAYRQSPWHLVGALACSILMTMLYALTLWFCAQAVGSSLSLSQIFIVLTIGVAGATVIPTPGGLGAAEATLAGGLMLYGVEGANAVAIALLYRLFTYWLAFVIGFFAFLYSQRRHYL